MRRRSVRQRFAVGVTVVILALVACEEEPDPPTPPGAVTGPSIVTTSTISPSTTAAPPTFVGAVTLIDDATKDGMTSSWHLGCPVPIEDLRLVTVRHWGFDGEPRDGELVVHADVADGVLGVFRVLFDARFPLERIERVDAYGGDDDASMAANNTSAFNCRLVSGSSRWSEHAYGRAIDVNPVQNPYVAGSGTVAPPAGTHYVDRADVRPGMVVAGDPVVKAFDALGWGWGGGWSTSKDYQHFSATGL